MVVFGEDVGVKGGVYGVTGAWPEPERQGADTLLDEQSILGLGLAGAPA